MPNDGTRPRTPGQNSGAISIRAISRAAAVLRSLMNVRTGLSLSQIAERVDLPRATVQRIVNALAYEKFVRQPAGPRGGYRLGPEIDVLSRSVRFGISEIVRPHLASISQSTGETVDFSILRGQYVLFLDQLVGTHRLRAVSAVGDTFPLTNTSNGKSCLALLDDTRARALIQQELRSSKDVERIMKEIAEVRRTHFGFNNEEHTVGISAVAIGFRDLAGSCYAISVPVPTARFEIMKDEIVRQLLSHRQLIIKEISAEKRNAI